MKIPTKEQIQWLEKQYPVGTRVVLRAMDDPQAPPPGTKGTVRYVDGLAAQVKESGCLPPINHDALTQSYPGAYQSLLQIIHNTGERVGRRLEEK